MEILYFIIPSSLTAAATVVGVARAKAPWPGWRALGAWLALIVATGGLFATAREPGVTETSWAGGIVIGSTMVAALPLLIYYGLGRALAGHRIVLAVLWVASMVPLYFFLFWTGILAWGLVHCPPDAYECPV